MAAVAISGVNGSITGPSFAAQVYKWTAVTENQAHEFSVFGEWDNDAVSGLRRHTGTLEFVLVSGTDEPSDIDGATGATTVAMVLVLLGAKDLTLTAFLDNITITQDIEDITRGTATFVGNGAAVYTEASD